MQSILGDDYRDTYILQEKLLFDETGLIFDGEDYVYAAGFDIEGDEYQRYEACKRNEVNNDENNESSIQDERNLFSDKINSLVRGNISRKKENANNTGLNRPQINNDAHMTKGVDSKRQGIVGLNEQTTIVDLGGEKVRVVFENGQVTLMGVGKEDSADTLDEIMDKDIKTGVEVVKLGKKNVTLSKQVPTLLVH